MQLLGQCFDFGEYVRKLSKKVFFVHTAINKMREEHTVFSSNGGENSFGDSGFFCQSLLLTAQAF